MPGYRRTTRNGLTVLAVLAGSGAAFAGPAAAQSPTPAPIAQVVPVPHSITTIAGNGTTGSLGDGGVAVKAQLNVPSGVAEDLAGSLYISDTANNKIRKVVNPTTINQDFITTFAGTGVAGFSGDGGPATQAKINTPIGVAVDSHGDVFFADSGNGRVREVLPNGIIQTIAGNGGSCNPFDPAPLGNGGPATAATLCGPTGVAVDRSGDVFVSDTGHFQVREIKPNGIISAFAGTGIPGYSGNGGQATKARLGLPTGLAVDNSNNVYIADTSNSVVRKVAPNGVITNFAGNHTPGYGGDGGPATSAKLLLPTGLAVDQSGDVFISDTGNQRLREVVPGGTISTFAGTGVPGFSGDGGSATSAKLFLPTGAVAVDGTAVYFSDTGNQRVRGVFNGPPPVLPELNYSMLFPVSGLLLAGLGFLVVRRRRRSAILA